MISPAKSFGFAPAGAAIAPWWVWIMPGLLLPLAMAGPNEWLSLYALAVLTVGLAILWRPGEPPILLFVFLYQWLQSATGALYGNAMGMTLAELVPWYGYHEFSVGLMLTGVLVLALAMRATAGRPVRDLHARIVAVLSARPFSFWLRIYAAVWVFGMTCNGLASYAGGLRLPLLTLSGVKWAAFVLLTFAAYSGPTRGARKTWLAVFAFEFVLSIGGFFADFKEVFLYALFGLLVSNVRFTARALLLGALFGTALIFLALIWTAIKGDYRHFVNGGTGQQVVTVDYNDRLQEIGLLLGEIDTQELQDATHDFFERLMYHHFFGAAAANVPEIVPYTGGEIWSQAIASPFMPRLLFPEKRSINDSDLTNQYTGLNVATAEQGTSISLGYMAEAYIDFGPILMFGAIAALGVGLGSFYRWLLLQPGSLVVVGAALAPFALMPAHLAETSILKMIPSLGLSLITCLIVLKILIPLMLGRITLSRSIKAARHSSDLRRRPQERS